MVEQFYVLERPKPAERDAGTELLPLPPLRTGEAPRCPVCGRFVGMRPLLPPISAELTLEGKYFGDVAWGPVDIYFSKRFVDEFQVRAFRGLDELLPVTITKQVNSRQASNRRPDYFLACPVRGRAVVDDARSGAVRSNRSNCPECLGGNGPERLERLVFVDDSWSGEDIFVARGLPGTSIVTEALRRMCIDMGFRNFAFTEAANFRIDWLSRSPLTA